jgi:tRNA threonylcarbamoyladenosine biosynthesis protein TsaB
MNILSIDVSSNNLSIALLKNEQLREEKYLSGKNYSDNIIPKIKKMLEGSNLRFKDINGVSFGAGPGSFTGMRIASGVAYGIAFANDIPIVGISNLEALAKKSNKKNTIACIDARMNQIYLGAYEKKDDEFSPLIDNGLFDPEDLPDINVTEANIVGSAVKIYRNCFQEKYKKIKIELDERDYALAGSIALLAKNRFSNEFDLKQASPIYIRNKVAQTLNERSKKINK